MNNLVVYKNDMNTVPLRDFSSKEMDLFFSICSQMRDKGLDEITFTFEQLKDLSNYKFTAYDRFIKDIENVYNKLIKLNIRIETEEKIVRFVLFTKYEIDKTKTSISISVNKEFKYILNDITGNFTKFELAEFVSLKSSYSKTAYKLIKQFRTTGYMVLTIDDFRQQFCIPKSYRMTDINKQIFEKIHNELSAYFKNLEINKISKGRGRKITHIEFVFNAEIDINATGSGTFRDRDGFYYNKPLLDFNTEEANKKFKDSVEPMVDRYDKKRLKEKEERKRKWLEMFPEDVDLFK
ncbi:hypothetical protein HMPREF9628_02212 [Peptoanaerobacter stomatis]|jgi:initiator repB protein|uniref:Initiator Rep protein WH1 domain-containing protein n=1 Tax=Peptoanaerobacter stomatis TaxID=796937 RepID=G9XF59_9FIRM|nr:replication initiation protein [Peptoanaerobacter stomatis]EHL17553.1 hypothetical protein HMPREF9628_02212 [Peptoanaerobacter stomatis]